MTSKPKFYENTGNIPEMMKYEMVRTHRVRRLHLDGHAWCEDVEGNVVYDPCFKWYDYICNLHGCAKKKKRHYKVQANMKETVLKIVKSHIKEGKQIGLWKDFKSGMEFWRDFLEGEDEFEDKENGEGKCFINAYCYKYFHPEVKLMIGSMGFEKDKSNEVWWEYG